MSTASDLKFTPDPSQGDYWGGYMLDATVYKALAMFPLTGLLGIDHLALRSPFTALLKLLINLFFYGAWYFYDIIQIVTDSTFVAKYGMTTPWGPRGHAYKFFSNLTEQNIGEFDKASPYNGGFFAAFLFLLYLILGIFLGFTGLPSILAGDFSGGIAKLFSNFAVIPFFFYLVFMPYEFFKAGSVEKTGVPRTWPLAPWFMLKETHPALNLLPKEEAEKQAKEYKTSLDLLVKENKKPILMELFSQAMDYAGQAITAFPPVAAFTTVTAAKGSVLAASEVGQSLAKAVQKRVATNPDEIVDKLLGPVKETTASLPTEAALPTELPLPAAMKGGSMDMTQEFDKLLIGGLGFLIVGGFVVGILRKFTLPMRENEDRPPRGPTDRNDAPPNPRTV